MWTVSTGISGGVGAICLVGALLLWTVGRQMWPPVVLALTITGVAGILNTPIGGWIRGPVGWLSGSIGGAIGRYTGIAVFTVAAVAVAVIVVLHSWHHYKGKGGINERTLMLGAALPLVAGAIPGAIGAAVIAVLGFLTNIVSWPITAGFGL